MLAPVTKPSRLTAPLPLRFAWRELRGGVRGFGVFIACIALGVMAIAGVNSVAASLSDGLSRTGRVILGGDLAFTLIQREADDAERAFLDAHGTVSVAATLRAMARTPRSYPPRYADDGREGATLVEVKAVDGNYPLFGTVTTDPAMPISDVFAQHGDAYGAAVDPALLTRLDLKTGDRITIGNAVVELRAALTSEPDKLAGGIGLGPRVLLERGGAARERAPAARQSGALAVPLAPARRRRRRSRRGRDRKTRRKSEFPDAGWEVRTRTKASPQLERNVERFSQFLTLVALTTLLVGGVGVANAVASHLARKRDVIGTMKALGATGVGVFAIYCAEVSLVALFAALIGAALGARRCRSRSHGVSAASFRFRSRLRCIQRYWRSRSPTDSDRARLRAVAARARPRRVGIDAVSRPDRRGTALAAMALCGGDGVDRRRCSPRLPYCPPTTAASGRSSLRPRPAFS